MSPLADLSYADLVALQLVLNGDMTQTDLADAVREELASRLMKLNQRIYSASAARKTAGGTDNPPPPPPAEA